MGIVASIAMNPLADPIKDNYADRNRPSPTSTLVPPTRTREISPPAKSILM
jgi:hypothetical protein